MFVAINDKLFDPNKVKVLIILSPTDIRNIKIMDNNGNNCYCMYPKGNDKGEVHRWMARMVKEAEAVR